MRGWEGVLWGEAIVHSQDPVPAEVGEAATDIIMGFQITDDPAAAMEEHDTGV